MEYGIEQISNELDKLYVRIMNSHEYDDEFDAALSLHEQLLELLEKMQQESAADFNNYLESISEDLKQKLSVNSKLSGDWGQYITPVLEVLACCLPPPYGGVAQSVLDAKTNWDEKKISASKA